MRLGATPLLVNSCIRPQHGLSWNDDWIASEDSGVIAKTHDNGSSNVAVV